MSLRPILIAEDDVNDVIIFRRVCERCHVKNQLRFVSDGDEVTAYLNREGEFGNAEISPTPALLLLDLKMRRMGGLQVLAWLQTKPKPDFPVIILTGLQDLSQMREAYRMGAHSFLLKPVEQNDFAAFIDKFKGVEIGT
jgi:CheY-like chemotaxis protein